MLISKSQVLALFLTLTSAQDLTIEGLLNGPSDVANVPEGQDLTIKNSLAPC